jgi:CBS domain-containing protein
LRPRDPVAFAINWMAIEGFRNVPIVDDDGSPLGVLTVFDLMRALSAILDNIEETPRENLQAVSSISKVFDVGGGS